MKKHLTRVCYALLLPALLLPAFPSGVIADGKTLTADKATYMEGEEILLTATGSGNDWVGIYRKGELPDPGAAGGEASIRWYYVAKDGNTSGTAKNIFDSEYVNRTDLADLPVGDYTVYLFADDGYDVLARVDITVNEDPALHTVPATPSKAEYHRTGSFPGAADGRLTVTAGEEDALPDGYRAYWADETGPLAAYTAFAPIPCTGTVTAYDMVANTLIPKEADRILVYAVRGRKISEGAAEVMLPEGCNAYDFGTPVYELQVLSDIHINSSQSHLHNRHFASALADIQALSPNSIGIFINGDIADHGEIAEYLSFRQLVQDAGLSKVYAAIGNHDLAAGPYEEKLKNFLEHTEPGTDSVYYDLWIEGVHFLFLGSEAPGLNATLSPGQLDWLREKLAENRDETRPIYVFLHQGLIDTVAGTFAYQGWHGIEQAERLADILKAYPEVILFTGHSHWEMDSFQTMKPRDGKLPTVFNTAAGAYLWNDASMATDVGVEGSQGYYLYAYEDKVLLLGRDFVTGQWIASAQFLVDYGMSAADGNGTETPEESADAPSLSGADPAPPVGRILGGIAAGLAIAAAAAAAIIVKRKRKSGR